MDVTERVNAIEISSYVYMRGGPFSAGNMYAQMTQTRPDPERFCLDQDLRIADIPHSDSQKNSESTLLCQYKELTRPRLWTLGW